MTTVILKGEEAIHFAEEHGLSLSMAAGAGMEAQEGLTPDEARQHLAAHPELIWVETHIGVNSGEPPHAW